jgi:hypothetical protein
MCPGGDEQRCTGVPQIVEAEVALVSGKRGLAPLLHVVVVFVTDDRRLEDPTYEESMAYWSAVACLAGSATAGGDDSSASGVAGMDSM